MYRKEYQKGFLSVFSSLGSSPLKNWETKIENGCIERIVDEELKSLVLEITGCNISTTYITCPKDKNASLGIRMPICTFNWNNVMENFTFEIVVLDDKNLHRRFRFSNFIRIPRIKTTFFAVCPIKKLHKDWIPLKFNLADMTKKAFCSVYIETVRIQINANCRLKGIYFSDELYADEDIPNELRLHRKVRPRKVYVPFQKKQKSVQIRPATPDSSVAVPWIQGLRGVEKADYNEPPPSVASSDEYECGTYTRESEEEILETEKELYEQPKYDESKKSTNVESLDSGDERDDEGDQDEETEQEVEMYG